MMTWGRELDAAVAVEIMGWAPYVTKRGRWCVNVGGERREGYEYVTALEYRDGEEAEIPWWKHVPPPHFSCDIEDAMELVEYVREKHKACFHLNESRYGGLYCDGEWVAYFGTDPGTVARLLWGSAEDAARVPEIPGTGVGETMEHAIACAALRWVRERKASDE